MNPRARRSAVLRFWTWFALAGAVAMAQAPAADDAREPFAGAAADQQQDQQQPQLAVRADGALALAFAEPGKAVRVAVRLPGADWQAPRTVLASKDLAAGMHRGPRVAWAGAALLVSCIEARFDAATKTMHGSRDLLVRRSTDLGATWTPPVCVNGEHGSAAEGLHALAAAGDRVAVVWLDPRGEPKGPKVFCAWSRDGGITFGAEFVAHATAAGGICPCCHPSLAFDGDGNAVAMWRDANAGNRDLWCVALGDGKVLGEPRQAGTGHWRLEACPMDGGGLGVAGDGRAVTVWRRENKVFWTCGGPERLLGEGRNPALAARGGRAFAAWERAGDVVGAVLELDGNTTAAPAVAVLGAGAFPCVAALPDGQYVVVAERRAAGGCRIVMWER